MRKTLSLILLFIAAVTMSAGNAGDVLPLKLWYDRPAHAFEESLPIGNGKIGALILGGANCDSLYLNDLTLWTGGPVDRAEGGDAHKYIPEIRKALFAEDYKRADSLQLFVQGHNSEFYQPLGMIHITDLSTSSYTSYYRELDLRNAIARTTYERDGVVYTREYFASNPDKVIAVRLTANRPGSINCRIDLTSQLPHKVKSAQGQLTMTGRAMDVKKVRGLTHFCSMLKVNSTDGEVVSSDTTVTLRGCTEAVIYLCNETSYNGFDKNPETDGAPYIENVADDQWHLVNYTYDMLRERHVADYKGLFDRVEFTLGGAKYDTKRTTEQQLIDYTRDGNNTYLESLLFHYGRYLLISCSRTPNLPANLQGLWSWQKKAPWRGNYTININTEENYWMADMTSMSELLRPLEGLLQAMSVTGRETAKHYYGVNRGWCAGHNIDAWAMTNPVGTKRESPKWSNWNMGGAWLVETLWDHYQYSLDKEYLRSTAYPLMKGAAEFLLDWLVENPNKPSELITAPCTSPEAEFITDKGVQACSFYGGTSDLAIIRELLQNTISACDILGVDAPLRAEMQAALDRLHPYMIGKAGNLQEWYYDWEMQEPTHRHQSHILGLHPFQHINLQDTPDLAQACAKTLEMRGDYSTGWSSGWRISLWARLHRPDKSYQMLRRLLRYIEPKDYTNPKNRPKDGGGTYPNLFDAHPPFQIDGNFGGTAGIIEMLVQSRLTSAVQGTTVIDLLPSLPAEWPSGAISGISVRGGYTVDLQWKDSKVVKVTITNRNSAMPVTVNYNGKTVQKTVRPGKSIVLK